MSALGREDLLQPEPHYRVVVRNGGFHETASLPGDRQDSIGW